MATRSRHLLIIGGGPAGLTTAARAAELLSPDLWKVTVVEQRPEYTRDQIILLDSLTLDGLLPEDVLDDLLGPDGSGCYVESIERDPLALCFLDPLPVPAATVTLSDLERALLDYVEDNDVTVIRPEGPRPLDIEFRPEESMVLVDGVPYRYDVLVGADGARSRVRREVLGANLIPFQPNERLYAVAISARTDPERLGGIFETPEDVEEYRAAFPRGGGVGASVLHPPDRPPPPRPYGEYFFRSRSGAYFIAMPINQDEFDVLRSNPRAPFLMRRVAEACARVQAECVEDSAAIG